MIKIVLFDLDDTLILEVDYVKSGFEHVSNILAKKYHLNSNLIYSELQDLFLKNHVNVFNRWFELQNIPLTDEDIKILVNEYHSHKPNIDFCEDVIPAITKLRDHNMKLGIVTDGNHETQQLKLSAIQADKYFDYIYKTDDYGKDYWKPSSKIFELIKEETNSSFNEMVYIGDNPRKDFYIRKSLAMKTFRIVRNDSIYKNEQYLDNIIEDYQANNLNDIVEQIIKLKEF